MRSPREVVNNYDSIPRTQTKYALGTPTVLFASPAPAFGLARKEWVWKDERQSQVKPPTNWNTNGSYINLDEGETVTLQAVIGYNRDAARQFLRIRGYVPGDPSGVYTLLISFPVEGLQAFSYAQPLRIGGYREIIVDFAAAADPVMSETADAFFGTVLYAPDVASEGS